MLEVNHKAPEKMPTMTPKFFQELFQEFYAQLVRYAYRYVYDAHLSEDLVQDVFVKFWEKREILRIHTSFKSYLYTMVRNRCLDYLNQVNIKDNSLVIEQLIYLEGDGEANGLGPQEQTNLALKCSGIVQKLPSQMQKVVRLRYYENCSYQWIAEELNISVNTVKTQLKRAKIKILKMLSDSNETN